jgi:hypothetical protein
MNLFLRSTVYSVVICIGMNIPKININNGMQHACSLLIDCNSWVVASTIRVLQVQDSLNRPACGCVIVKIWAKFDTVFR